MSRQRYRKRGIIIFVVIQIDTEAPKIFASGAELGATATFNTAVTLTITDDVGVTSVTINGEEKDAPYELPAVDGEYTVIAYDAAGNSTQVVITLESVVEPEPEPEPELEPEPEPEPEPSDPPIENPQTTVFRKIKGEGVEIVAKENVEVRIYDLEGNIVKSSSIKKYGKIKITAGRYEMNLYVDGKMLFSNIPLDI